MRVRFIGTDDPTDDRACVVFGLSFDKGEWVDLDEVPPKLLTNPTFEVADPLDHDGDGRKGGSKPRTRRAHDAEEGA